MTTPPPEALAQAREQLPGIASQEHDNPSAATAIRERATAIELRRQLAEEQESLALQTAHWAEMVELAARFEAELATERQRADDLERQLAALSKSCGESCASEMLSLRQRAEAAETALVIAESERDTAASNAESWAETALAHRENAQSLLDRLEASEAKRKALLRAGTMCSSACFNLARYDVIDGRTKAVLQQSCDAWDAAVAADTNAQRSDAKDTPCAT